MEYAQKYLDPKQIDEVVPKKFQVMSLEYSLEWALPVLDQSKDCDIRIREWDDLVRGFCDPLADKPIPGSCRNDVAFLIHGFGIIHLPLLERWERSFYDFKVRQTTLDVSDPRIVIVDIDDKSMGPL